MSAGRPEDRVARLFVALELPLRVRGALGRWGGRELSDTALRPVRPESLHMTLCFLGATSHERIPDAAELITGVEPAPVEVSFRPALAARPRRRPGLLAVEADAPAAVSLQAELASRLVALGLLEADGRPFWPHVTVARVRRLPGAGRRPRKLREMPGDLPESLTEPFGAVRVALYRSNLRPEGAKYVPLANFDLSPVGLGPGRGRR